MPDRRPESDDLIWRGRLQLGDEPGIYGDATYCGIAADFPIELFPYPGARSGQKGKLLIEAHEVKIYSGEPGHEVIVFGYFRKENSKQWERRKIASSNIAGSGTVLVEIELPPDTPKYISAFIQIDVSRPPGLYDEIVITRILLRSTTMYGYLGFRAPVGNS